MSSDSDRRNGRRASDALLAMAATVLAACSASVSPELTSDPAGFQLTSPAFSPGGAIPGRYTCDGRDTSPPLRWRVAPAGTRAFALIVSDPDAHGFIHWLITDLPAGTSELAEGLSGDAVGVEGRNGFGHLGWGGPCPPSGMHRYVFDLYALSGPLGLEAGFSSARLRSALTARTLGLASLTGTYRRG